MVTARGRLRQTEDKIYLARHRLDVIRTLNSRFHKKKAEEERQKMRSLEISSFAKRQKEKKEEIDKMRLSDRQRQYEKNLGKKKDHQTLVESFKATLNENNKWIYQQTKK